MFLPKKKKIKCILVYIQDYNYAYIHLFNLGSRSMLTAKVEMLKRAAVQQ